MMVMQVQSYMGLVKLGKFQTWRDLHHHHIFSLFHGMFISDFTNFHLFKGVIFFRTQVCIVLHILSNETLIEGLLRILVSHIDTNNSIFSSPGQKNPVSLCHHIVSVIGCLSSINFSFCSSTWKPLDKFYPNFEEKVYARVFTKYLLLVMLN